MQEGDLVKIDLLVATSGNRKSKDAWCRIKKDFEELAQQPTNIKSMPCPECGSQMIGICINHGCEHTHKSR